MQRSGWCSRKTWHRQGNEGTGCHQGSKKNHRGITLYGRGSSAGLFGKKLENAETRAEILARSKYLLMMSPDKWTETQKERAAILFREYGQGL